MFRVLVCGGRDFADYAMACLSLDSLLANKLPDVVVIHGGAPGADSLAGRYAAERGLACEVFEADWQAHGRAAGPIRNARMLAEGKPDAVVAFAGGRGTADMVSRAKAAGVRVKEVLRTTPVGWSARDGLVHRAAPVHVIGAKWPCHQPACHPPYDGCQYTHLLEPHPDSLAVTCPKCAEGLDPTLPLRAIRG